LINAPVIQAVLVHISSRNALIVGQIHKRSNYFAENCKFVALARIS
jgi:hypothetical protein